MGDDFEKKETGEDCPACEGEKKCTEGSSEETGRNKTIGRSSVRWEDSIVIGLRNKMQQRGLD